MPHTYYEERSLKSAEHRIVMLSNEVLDLKREIQSMQDARMNLELIHNYDTNVRMLIASSSHLQEAWDNFAVLFQLSVSRELLETCDEKIKGDHSGLCNACKRSFPDPLDSDQGSYKNMLMKIKTLEHRLRELGEDV